MTCRVDSRRNPAPIERTVRAPAAPVMPAEPVVERPRRIDAYIDYFGSDAGGETLLDGGAS